MSTNRPSFYSEPSQPPSPYDSPASPVSKDELQMVYQALCTRYHDIEDFRLRLLGLLPFASAVSFVTVIFSDPTKNAALAELVLPFGFLGAFITIGLFFYEEENLLLSRQLMVEGKVLEDAMNIRGPFTPAHSRLFNAQTASALVYAVTIAGWICLALWFALPGVAIYVAVAVLIVSWPLAALRRRRLRTLASK